jgi:hypothetical protein
LFPFSEEQCLPSSIPSPTSQRRSLVAGVKSGVRLASCPLTSQTGGNCSAVCTRITNYNRPGILRLWTCGLSEAGLLCSVSFVRESRFCCLVESYLNTVPNM